MRTRKDKEQQEILNRRGLVASINSFKKSNLCTIWGFLPNQGGKGFEKWH